MDLQTLQVFAGFASSAMFVAGNLPMLLKAYKTKNLKSYSVGMTSPVENGQSVEHWEIFDQVGLMQQLGVIPAPGS